MEGVLVDDWITGRADDWMMVPWVDWRVSLLMTG